MPLQVDVGIPIIPKDQAPELLAVNKAPDIVEAELTTVPHVLEIDPVLQRQDQWCWAACVEMVLAFYQRRADQCFIVGKKKGLEPPTSCCGAQEDTFSTEGCDPHNMKELWELVNVKVTPLLAANQNQPARLTFDQIKQQIEQKRPIEVGIKWFPEHGSGGHAVIIKGWEQNSDGIPVVWINDPLLKTRFHLTDAQGKATAAQGKVRLDELATNKNGMWLHTWTELTDELKPE